MLLNWYIQREFKQFYERTGVRLVSLEQLQQLAGLKQLIFPTSLLFYTGAPVVRQYFAVQDQTMATKQRVLQVAQSLVEKSDHPILQAIAQAGKEVGLPTREIEADEVAGVGVIGKLDRTWFVLGDEGCMNNEQIELGVTIQTLAHQFEVDGKYTIFLAQKQPKRLLAIFACEYEVRSRVPETIQNLRNEGIESVLLTGVKTRIAKGLGNRLAISLIHSEVTDQEKQRIAGSLLNQQPDSAFVEPASHRLFPVARALRIAIGKGNEEGVIYLQHLEDLVPLLQDARRIVDEVKRKFFWNKIN